MYWILLTRFNLPDFDKSIPINFPENCYKENISFMSLSNIKGQRKAHFWQVVFLLFVV